MTSREISMGEAERLGLLLGALSQVKASLEFEAPVYLGHAEAVAVNTVGCFTYIGQYSEIRNADIGRFCSIGSRVMIGSAEHPSDWLSSHTFQYDGSRYFDAFEQWHAMAGPRVPFPGNRKRTRIGNDVWIGNNVFVRQGVTIGDGAIIGACAVVVKDVEPYSIVVGSPAKTLRLRFEPELVERLLALRWWDYAIDRRLADVPYQDVRAAIEVIERNVAAGVFKRLEPSVHRVERQGRKHTVSDIARPAAG